MMCLRRSRTGCKLARGFVTSSAWSSKEAPTFSSSGNPKTCVTSLGLPRTFTHMFFGKPNRPIPEQFNLDIEEFSSGAAGAVEVVTSGLADGDYTSLEGLVTDQCISGLKAQNLQLLNDEQRKLLAVNSSDIFFTMLSEIELKPNYSEVLFVTFSFPQLGEMKKAQGEIREGKKEFDDKMKAAVNDIKEGVTDKDQFNAVTQDNINEFKEFVASHNTHNQFQETEILIGNYRFVRDGTSSNWTISQISQVNTFEAWPWLSRRRWKGRLGMHYKSGFDFYKVLRYDVITDFVFFLLLVNLTLSYGSSAAGIPVV